MHQLNPIFYRKPYFMLKIREKQKTHLTVKPINLSLHLEPNMVQKLDTDLVVK